VTSPSARRRAGSGSKRLSLEAAARRPVQPDHRPRAVVERRDLIGLDDESLLRLAAGERRALLTNNVRHFAAIARGWGASGQTHYGLVFTSDASLPRSRETIGMYVDALGALLDVTPGDEALRDQVRWLS
jgi:hypothetical protein